VKVSKEQEAGRNARDIYGLVKLIGEKLVRVYYEKHKTPTCALRFFNVYGPRQEASTDGFVVGIFTKQVIKGEQPTILGDGLQTRDFMFVEDTIEAMLRAFIFKKTNGEIINVGRGKQITILGLADRIIELSQKELKPEFLPERGIDIRYQCPDTKKMRRLLRFVPRYPLDKGLEKTYEWYQENL
ncbi:MAG: NAD-dependent epimerase/dehydratase family protein, partial [Candidatus Nealsonbacteria bacterium]|nr:NAD-dependent epimerase/dehydratase family protein [Candidatus Nealsonbacteria bacterium]